MKTTSVNYYMGRPPRPRRLVLPALFFLALPSTSLLFLMSCHLKDVVLAVNLADVGVVPMVRLLRRAQAMP